MATPRITLTTPAIAQGLYFSGAKNLREISTKSPLAGAPKRGGVGSNGRFSTNISLYLRNGAREGHSYYGKLIGTHMRSIEWRYFQ